MSKKRRILNCPTGSSGGSVFNSVYTLKPINKSAARGIAGHEESGWKDVKKSPRTINTDRLPDNSQENAAWLLRQKQGLAPKEQDLSPKDNGKALDRRPCVETLEKLILRSCIGVDGAPISYIIAGCFKHGGTGMPLRYIPAFSQRADCWPFLEEFVVRRRAECAAVLLARRLGVGTTKTIEEAVSEADLSFYYPVESRERCVQ